MMLQPVMLAATLRYYRHHRGPSSPYEWFVMFVMIAAAAGADYYITKQHPEASRTTRKIVAVVVCLLAGLILYGLKSLTT